MKDLDLSKLKRIVIKVGTNSITTKRGLNKKNIENLAAGISWLYDRGNSVVLVSSGAIGAGKRKTSLKYSNGISKKQAYASIGQYSLMGEYERAFKEYGLYVAQLLLSAEDFDSRKRLKNLCNVYHCLVKNRIIPIVNENDVTATEEINFGDNDKLSALITRDLDLNLLLILSCVDGVYKNKKILDKATSYKKEDYDNMIISKEGRGGLQSKLNAAKIVNEAEKPCMISNIKYYIPRIIPGLEKRTVFLPK